MKLCMFGAGSPNIDDKYVEVGYELGSKMSKNGYELIFGGGYDGMMGAVARGAADNDCKVTAIFPDWMENICDMFDKINKRIYTKTMRERKRWFMESSDVFVIMPGGLGTLDEIFEVLTLKKLKRHNKPVIFLNAYHFYDKTFEMINDMVEQNTIKNQDLNLYVTFDTVDEIFEYLNGYESKK